MDLVVETPEAQVRVVGTVFEVHRDTLGTEVTVDRGHVVVRCEDTGTRHELAAGGTIACLPVRAPGLVARAHTLHERGADASLVLHALDLALAREPDAATRAEAMDFIRRGAR